MKPSRTLLYRRSRDTRFLARVAIAIAIVSVLLGALISALTQNLSVLSFSERLALLPDEKDAWARSTAGDFAELDLDAWASYLRLISPPVGQSPPPPSSADVSPTLPFDDRSSPVQDEVSAPPLDLDHCLQEIRATEMLSDDERELIATFALGMLGDETSIEHAAEEMSQLAAASPPRRLAAEFLGDIRGRSGDWVGAIDAYRSEVERFPESAHRPLHLLVLLLKREDRSEEIGDLMARPELQSHFLPGDRIDHAIEQRDYLSLFFLTLKYDLRFDDPWLLVLSLFAASIWFVIVTQYSGRWRTQISLYLGALFLGCLSGSLTLYAVLVQEKILNFVHDPTSNLVDQILYCIAGIGLREETLKLLCFLPLAPLLAKRDRDEIDALVCAGLVGLGFALNENSGYVNRGGEFTTWSRFITANFFHIALTGVAGLSLVRCWKRPRRQWDNFLYDFLIVIAAHGVYDAFLIVPQFAGYDIVALVIFAVICYLFLDQATRMMRPQNSMTISPLAIFVVGSALLMGVVLCFACWAVPFRIALSQYSGGLGTMVPIAFIFISRLRNL